MWGGEGVLGPKNCLPKMSSRILPFGMKQPEVGVPAVAAKRPPPPPGGGMLALEGGARPKCHPTPPHLRPVSMVFALFVHPRVRQARHPRRRVGMVV